ncbi:MAG: ATP-binding protein [Oscillospiraceae bacterium]|nr:ATP-binding protein [Oscillospiraceae bacterium]
MHGSDVFEFAVIYGRRRVGKTTLIREFIKGKKNLFFVAGESTAADNLLSLSRCVGGRSTSPVYADYESALWEIFEMGESERFIFVIDEFPYLAGAYRGISSLLQIVIDQVKNTSKLMLILCGSSLSFMENQVLGYQSPLFGRRTAQFRILPFTFFEALPFFGSFEAEDKAILYCITGGTPEYLQRINNTKTVRENIVDLFLTPAGLLFEEPANLLKQELREPATYNAIIEAIASGASRLNEISTKIGLEGNKCAKYLKSLIALGLVGKEYPYGVTASKRSIYKLEDFMFRFWYRFVFPNMSAIVAGLGDGVYDNEVAPQLSTYMGLAFENICRQWLFEMAKKDALPFFAGNLGRWWGTDPKARIQVEIDIMSVRNSAALFAECKWSSSEIGIDVYHDLKRKSEIFGFKENFFYILTKAHPSAMLLDLEHAPASGHGFTKCYTLREMIGALGERPLKFI